MTNQNEEPPVDVLNRDLELRIEEARATVFHLQKLLLSDGWKTLEAQFRMIRMGRRNAVFHREGTGLDSLLDTADKLSELAGMEFILGLPAALITENQLELEALIPQNEED